MDNNKQTSRPEPSEDSSFTPEPDVTTKPKVAKVKVTSKSGSGGGFGLSSVDWEIVLVCEGIINFTSEVPQPLTIKVATQPNTYMQLVHVLGAPLSVASDNGTNQTDVNYNSHPDQNMPQTTNLSTIQQVEVFFDGDSTNNTQVPFEYTAD